MEMEDSSCISSSSCRIFPALSMKNTQKQHDAQECMGGKYIAENARADAWCFKGIVTRYPAKLSCASIYRPNQPTKPNQI